MLGTGPDVEVVGEGEPVVALVHGGFWRDRYDRSLMRPLADDVARRGWTAWNVEYRRGAGSWPACRDDVVAACAGADVVVGHSAGGHLALFCDAPLLVSLAGVNDVVEADRLGLGSGAVRDLVGPGLDVAVAQPPVPAGRVLLVNGSVDTTVPVLPVPGAEQVVLPGVDHMAVIDPGGEAWRFVVGWLGW